MLSSLTRATASGDTDATWWQTLSPLKADAVTPRRLPISPPLSHDFAYSPFRSTLLRDLSGSPGSPEHFSARPACTCCCYLS